MTALTFFGEKKSEIKLFKVSFFENTQVKSRTRTRFRP